MAQEQTLSEWIKVADERPEAETPVLVYDGSKMHVAAWRPENETWQTGETTALGSHTVTHWRPLPAPPVEEKQPRGKGVLFVEDNEAMREIVTILFSLEGITTFAFTNGVDALDFYKANVDKVGLVLLDVLLPQMSGIEAVDRFSALNPEVKIILITALSKKEVTPMLENSNILDVVRKPFDADALVELITEHLEDA